MLRKLLLASQNLKQNVPQTLEKCREVWDVCNKQRGVAVCRSIHIIFVIVTTCCALPYKVEKLENGYRKFVIVKGLRKWLVNGVYTYMVLRSISYALFPLSSELKLAARGNLTADCLIWVLSVQIAATPAILCYKFLRNSRDVAFVYNGIGQLMESASRKYFKGKHIFELTEIHWAVVLVLISTSAATFLTPIFSVPIFFTLKDSPSFLAYHISGPYSSIQDDDTFRIVLYWICSVVHWLYLNYLTWVMITMMALLGEGIIGITILLSIIRSRDPKEISCREKLKLHAQLEIILNVYNNWVGSAAPVGVMAALVLSVCSIVTLMKVDLENGFPKPITIPVFILMGAGGAFGGAMLIKYSEELRANSVGYLKEVEDTITAAALLEVRQKTRITFCPTGRTFRRRPIGVRMGSFMYFEEGLSTSYLMQVQDNTINYFFMVDLKSHPVWLW